MSSLTITEAAKQVGVTRQAIYLAIAKGRLQAFIHKKKWHILPDDLKKHVKSLYSREFKKRADGELLFDASKGRYSVVQLAKMARVSEQKVYYWLRSGRFDYERYGASYVLLIDDIRRTIDKLRSCLEYRFVVNGEV